ncbi:MAG: RNA polymerase sigma factor, partial [Chloroflexota bacterium]
MGAEFELPDEKLVSLSRNGDLDAFNRLVERYQSAVFGLCFRLLGRREAAEDATQEAFLSAYRALSRFDGGNVRSWLLRIAANESKDELRRRYRKDAPHSLDAPAGAEAIVRDIPDTREGAEQSAERSELHRIIEGALATLPFDQRQALVLVDLYEYRYEEAAEMTGVTLGTIKSRIHRARERLRAVLVANPELLAGYRRLDGGE